MPCLRGHNIVALIIDIDRRPWMYLKLISLLQLESDTGGGEEYITISVYGGVGCGASALEQTGTR